MQPWTCLAWFILLGSSKILTS
ncbi:unnamed protein product [Spirodela intermedia]|uniref:Uncharacterized protein n=2 Tax=Spirodela intermedia TaxID=51605 RepID=A0A7I8KAT7_SPIIN|nr:unnamed protein product [Spirodela intermedia]CAA6657964.1 unnamed protein product [Spirodela intermedia]CAA7394095.1 unnamed protein product [Spirodela intermedia]